MRKNGRIRGIPLLLKTKTYTINTYGLAKKNLIKCYNGRCGYSAIHMKHLGGIKSMEVDHFNPEVKKQKRQKYSSFVLSSRHCNGSKSNTWPTKAQQLRGIKLLNPRRDKDYWEHFEIKDSTGELTGITPAGIFHIEICDLNAEHLCDLRKESIASKKLLNSPAIRKKGKLEELQEAIALIKRTSNIFNPYPGPNDTC